MDFEKPGTPSHPYLIAYKQISFNTTRNHQTRKIKGLKIISRYISLASHWVRVLIAAKKDYLQVQEKKFEHDIFNVISWHGYQHLTNRNCLNVRNFSLALIILQVDKE